MSQDTPSVPSRTSRIIALVFVATMALAATIVLMAPRVAAAPAAPYFGPDARIDVTPAYTGYQPSIAVGSDGVAYLAFAGWAGSTYGTDIFFTKSSDGGRTWTTPLRVNGDAGGATQLEPSVALDVDNNIYISWSDNRNGNYDIFFAESTDGGQSFSANVRVNDVTTNAQMDSDLAIDSQGSVPLVHVVWTDNRNAITTGPDIYYANSTDGGLSFNPSQRINNDATGAEQAHPSIALGPDRSAYVVWDDPRTGGRGRDIYFTKSTDLGNTWVPNILINDDTGNIAQTDPAIAVDETGAIFLAWTDGRTTNTAPDIYATRSTNGGSSFAANVKVNDEAGAVWQGSPSLAASAGRVRLVWSDGRTVGSTGYDIYTASSTDGLSWSANLKVNDDSLPNNYQQTPTVGQDAFGDVFVAWFDQRATGQDVYAGTLDVVVPTADAGIDQNVAQGGTVSFDGSASTDNFAIASYAWDFGDGGAASGVAPTHAFTTPGTYTVALTVWDYSGNAATDSMRVTVRDTVAPVALGGGDRVVDEGQPLFFDASASTDNVGVVSYGWDLGDNSSSTEASVTHVYDRPGTYTVTLTVRDAAGNLDTTTMTVTVRMVSPKASELLGMIQLLEAIVALLAAGLLIVGYLAFVAWRRRREPPAAAPRVPAPPASQVLPPRPPTPPGEQDPLDMPLPYPEGPKAP